jgi:hypothetical protein
MAEHDQRRRNRIVSGSGSIRYRAPFEANEEPIALLYGTAKDSDSFPASTKSKREVRSRRVAQYSGEQLTRDLFIEDAGGCRPC